MDVGPGTLVVAVVSRDRRFAVSAVMAERMGAAHIVAGRHYVVKDVCPGIVGTDGYVSSVPAYVLCEPDTHWTAFTGRAGTWSSAFFRPIRKPPIDALKRLLDAPADLRELEGV